MEHANATDRRIHTRHDVQRPCKLRDRHALLFSSGHTCNVSDGGVMVRIDRPNTFAVGDELHVAVAWQDLQLVPSRTLMRATIRRVTPVNGRSWNVAVEFAEPIEVANRVSVAA